MLILQRKYVWEREDPDCTGSRKRKVWDDNERISESGTVLAEIQWAGFGGSGESQRSPVRATEFRFHQKRIRARLFDVENTWEETKEIRFITFMSIMITFFFRVLLFRMTFSLWTLSKMGICLISITLCGEFVQNNSPYFIIFAFSDWVWELSMVYWFHSSISKYAC